MINYSDKNFKELFDELGEYNKKIKITDNLLESIIELKNHAGFQFLMSEFSLFFSQAKDSCFNSYHIDEKDRLSHVLSLGGFKAIERLKKRIQDYEQVKKTREIKNTNTKEKSIYEKSIS